MKIGKKILIVEDELISAEYLKELLKKHGFFIVGVVNCGRQAIDICKKQNVDLVLMDVMLNDNISGCEAAVEIKHMHKDIKIIFLTAYATEEMIEYAYASEAYGYLLKPYREEEILATVKLAFSHHETTGKKEVVLPEKIPLKNGYVYHTGQQRLLKEEQEVPLGKKPLKLIDILVKNKNKSVSNEQICSYIWGEQKDASTLRSLIHRIRSIIGNDMIVNVNGMGYEITTH